MKNIIIFLLALVTIISCKKENDDSNNLEGKIKYIIINSNSYNDTFYFYYDSTDLWLATVKNKNDSIVYTIDRPISNFIKVSLRKNAIEEDSLAEYKYTLLNNYINSSYLKDNSSQQFNLVNQYYTTNGYLDSIKSYSNIGSTDEVTIDSVQYVNKAIKSFELSYFHSYPIPIFISNKYDILYNENLLTLNPNWYSPSAFINMGALFFNSIYGFFDPIYFLNVNGYSAYKTAPYLIEKINLTFNDIPSVISENFTYSIAKNRVNEINIESNFSPDFSGKVKFGYY